MGRHSANRVINGHKSLPFHNKIVIFMKKIQLDRYNRLFSVNCYLRKNKALFAANVPLVTTAVALNHPVERTASLTIG